MAAQSVLDAEPMSEGARYDVSVILPFGDDEEFVGIAVRRTAEHLRGLGLTFEIIAVDGPRTILATVAADRFDAIVVALRTDATLVTVSIADFTGKKPTQDEAVKLAEKEAEKIKQPNTDRSSVEGAYNGTWTPGFGFGASGSAIAGAPFFAWPNVLGNSPVPFNGESSDETEQRRQTTSGVQYQSHVEGPFLGAASPWSNHGLYYSGQTSFFGSSGSAKNFHDDLSVRLKIGLPGIKLTKIQVSSKERRYTYRVTAAIGTLSGVVLHRLVSDADYPLGFTLHVLAVPGSVDTPAIASGDLKERLDPVIREMADGLELALVAPASAPLTIGVSAPISVIEVVTISSPGSSSLIGLLWSLCSLILLPSRPRASVLA